MAPWDGQQSRQYPTETDMTKTSLALAAWAFALWSAPGAGAENSPETPGAASSAYRSVFTDYRGFREEPAHPWAAANEEMGRLGGHGGHAKGLAPETAGGAESEARRNGARQRP
jgi:hypothetical protein